MDTKGRAQRRVIRATMALANVIRRMARARREFDVHTPRGDLSAALGDLMDARALAQANLRAAQISAAAVNAYPPVCK